MPKKSWKPFPWNKSGQAAYPRKLGFPGYNAEERLIATV